MTQLITQLPSPYKELAEMRRAQQGGEGDYLWEATCLLWKGTKEGYDFWRSVYHGEFPLIPDASLSELNAWMAQQSTSGKVLDPAHFERVEPDPINPDHYKHLPKEVIDIIQFTLTPEQFKGYLLGNAMKYRLRAGLKGDAAEDLAKARWYEERAKNL